MKARVELELELEVLIDGHIKKQKTERDRKREWERFWDRERQRETERDKERQREVWTIKAFHKTVPLKNPGGLWSRLTFVLIKRQSLDKKDEHIYEWAWLYVSWPSDPRITS